MSCYRTLKAWRDSSGRIHFQEGGSGLVRLELPCGQCIGCRADRAKEWALRAVHEAQMHDRSCFVTLTYSNECLPSDGSLRLEDWQKFARRVRKAVGPFRFLHCGEYGEANNRPHYHACVFGLDFGGDRYVFKKNRRGETLWRSPTLEALWPSGFSTIGALTFESAAYVARYVMKKATGARAVKRYSRLDPVTGETWRVRPEYCTMSRRPGLGAKWFDCYQSDVFPADEVVHDGRRFRVPRFYDEKLRRAKEPIGNRLQASSVDDGIRRSPEVTLEEVKVARRARVKRRAYDMTAERLAVRERCAEARLSLQPRDL